MANEKGRGQTESPFEKKAEMWWRYMAAIPSKSPLERGALEGDSPVCEGIMSCSERVGLLG